MTSNEFEPKIVIFACNWCSYPAADAAGVGRMQYPANTRVIRVMCAGRINPSFVLKAFELGADGVLVTGCHLEDCHYLFGAKQTVHNFERTRNLVTMLGINPVRIRYEMISAAEAPKFARVVREFTAEVKKAGPGHLKIEHRTKTVLPDVIDGGSESGKSSKISGVPE